DPAFNDKLSRGGDWNRLGGFGMSAARQAHLNHRPAGLAIPRGNISAMLLDDAVADAQAQARALAHALGGVERIENAVGLLDAGTGILELGDHIPFLGVDSYLQ